MIKVKLVGGAKKSFSTEYLEVENSEIPVSALLEIILKLKPTGTPDLDIKNILIAINGVDSSALQGLDTLIHNNDLVSIIPIIHGGIPKNISFRISNRSIQLVEINHHDPVTFLESLRTKFPNVIIQGISSRFILSNSHAKKVISISLQAEKTGNLLSNKMETDLLMRFAGTTQISQAIKIAGIKPKQNFIIISIGKSILLKKISDELKPYSKTIFSKNNKHFLKQQFHITKTQLDSVYSKTSLEDILVEKAAILFG